MGNDTEKLIELTTRRKDFEEIYFKERNYYFNSKDNKKLLVVLFLAVVFSVSFYHSVVRNKYIVLTIMSFLCLLPVVVNYIGDIYRIWEWKQSTNDYLDEMIRFKKSTLLLTEQAICLTQDTTVTIEKWTAITNVVLQEDYLSFEGQQYFVFPKKSMTESEFDYFKNLVKEKVTNG